MIIKPNDSFNLFVYGTLLFEAVWDLVVGCAVRKQPARLKGWARFYMRNRVYPGIRALAGAEVEGLLICHLNQQNMAALDEFEDVIYTKKYLQVSCLADNRPASAYAYIVDRQHEDCLSDKPWQPDEFERSQLDIFLRNL